MSSSNSFSYGVENLLGRVRPHGRPATVYPEGLVGNDTRREDAESLHQWFVRLVDKYCDGDPNRVAVEEHIAVFASFAWEQDRLAYASVPTVVAEGGVELLYLEPTTQAVYLRLDLNYATLGEPFSHPLAHVHVADDCHPRFALDGGLSGNVIVDYLEFVYRNYVADKWLMWARRQWLSSGHGGADDLENDPFELVVKAFEDGQFPVLASYSHALTQIKKTLREAKDAMFSHHMKGLDRGILEYPSAR